MGLLGATVKKLRQQISMSQIQLADLAGLTQATISRLERGDSKSINSEALAKIAAALDVSSDYLMGVPRKVRLQHAKISQEELNTLVRGYQELNPHLRKKILNFLEYAKKPFAAFVIEGNPDAPYRYRRMPYLEKKGRKKFRRKQ